MNLRSSLIKIFNLEKGEEKVVLLIILYSFFIGASLAFFVSSTTGMFLNLFERKMLPISFIASGIIVYLVGLVFSNLQKKIRFSNLLNIAITFLFISSTIFLIFYMIGSAAWVVFILYSWIRVFGYIHSVTFWGLASKLFSLRQGKRVFGLIGSGEVISSIISFFSIPVLLRFITTEDLLIIAIICMIISFFLMFLLVKKNKVKLSDIGKYKSNNNENQEKPKISFFENKYFSIIFFIALLPVLSQFLVDFIFQAQLKVQFPQKDALTGFVGLFFGFTSIIEFVLKTFLSGRLISRYGIKLGLLVFPLMLVFSFVFASLTGTFDSTISLFFPFVALGRLFSRAARTSFHDPSAQILFQPIPIEIRLAFQSKIEGGPKAFGNIIAGVIILLLSTLSFLSLVHFAYILLAIVIYWTKVSYDAYKEYKKTIQAVLNTDMILSENEIDNTNTNLNYLKENLLKTSDNSFEKLSNFARKIEPQFIDNILVEIFDKVDIIAKEKIIDIFYNRYNLRDLKIIYDKISENDIFSEKAILVKSRIEYLSNINFETVINKSNSNEFSDRLEASNILRFLKRFNSYKYIFNLLNDKEFAIKTNAITASGENRNNELWQKLFEFLKVEALRNYAISSIIEIGESILYELEKYSDKYSEDTDLQITIISIFGRISSKKSIQFLRKNINSQNRRIKFATITALNNLGYEATRIETTHTNNAIETEIELIVWITAAIEDLRLQASQKLLEAVNYEFEQKKNDLFNLLALIYTKKNIDVIKNNLSSTTGDNKGYALEILDMIFSEEIKFLLLPLFENTSSFEILNAYKFLYPQKKLSYSQRLSDIINKNYSDISLWFKALALLELNLVEDQNFKETIFIVNIPNPNLILKEIACSSLFKLNNATFLDQVVKLKTVDTFNISHLKNKIGKNKHDNVLFIYEKVEILKKIKFLENSDFQYLLCIAEESSDIFLNENRKINANLNKYLILVLSGEISVSGNGNTEIFKTNSLIDYTLNNNTENYSINAFTESSLLFIDYNKVLNFTLKNTEIIINYIDYITQYQ